jgi:hypothetical protein
MRNGIDGIFEYVAGPRDQSGVHRPAQALGLFVFEGEKWKLGSERPKTRVPKGGTRSTRRTTIRVGRNEPSVVQKGHSIA